MRCVGFEGEDETNLLVELDDSDGACWTARRWLTNAPWRWRGLRAVHLLVLEEAGMESELMILRDQRTGDDVGGMRGVRRIIRGGRIGCDRVPGSGGRGWHAAEFHAGLIICELVPARHVFFFSTSLISFVSRF